MSREELIKLIVDSYGRQGRIPDLDYRRELVEELTYMSAHELKLVLDDCKRVERGIALYGHQEP